MVNKHNNKENNKKSVISHDYLFIIFIILLCCSIGSCVGWIPNYPFTGIIENWIFLLFLSGITFIIAVLLSARNETYHHQKKAEYEKLFFEQNKIKFEQNKIKLESSPHQKLIENFVATNQLSSWGNISKLKILLDNKGIVFDYEELKSIVMEEKERQDYENFKRTILHDRPTELRDYIVNLLDFYGENYAYQIDIFIKLLRENKIEIDENEIEIINDIRNVRREIELQQYENKLLYSEKSYSISDLDLLSGSEFELFLKELFEKMGYLVEHTKLSGDQGADLIISKFGHKVAVQAKNYTANVGNKAIQEVVSAIKHYKADRGMVVATSDFTQPAIELAKSNDIELIDRHRLAKLMEKYL